MTGQTSPDTPVLVVGAGPVGMTAALHLARYGVPSVILEAEPERSAVGSRSICVQGDMLDVLERVGAGWPVVEAGVTWYSGRIYYREHELVHLTLPEPPPGRFPPFVNTPQTTVERILADLVDANPLITLHPGHRVESLTQNDTGVTVTTPSGSFHGTHCIAADGAHSTIRTLLDLPFEGTSYKDKFLITDIRATLDFPTPERRFYFDPEWNPGRQVLLHPQPDNVWRIDWQVPEDFDLSAERDSGGLDTRVRQIVGNKPYEILWASSYRFHQRRVPHMTIGNTLLAGDAAHIMSPFGARGMNSGLADAENAAWKIAAIRTGWATPTLLTTYDTERSAAAAENLRTTTETMRFLVPATPEDQAHRHSILTRSITDPTTRPHINSGRLYEPHQYLDSPLTTPTASDPAPTSSAGVVAGQSAGGVVPAPTSSAGVVAGQSAGGVVPAPTSSAGVVAGQSAGGVVPAPTSSAGVVAGQSAGGVVPTPTPTTGGVLAPSVSPVTATNSTSAAATGGADPATSEESVSTARPATPGAPRPPVPGVLCPDVLLTDGRWLRSALGPGFTLLATQPRPGPWPTLTPTPAAARALGLTTPNATAVLRPDGYLAAVLPDGTGVEAAIARASGTYL